MNEARWTPEMFSLRRYTVEGGDLDKARKIEVVVKIDGRPIVQVQAREPGIIAFVSRPEDQGFNIDIVEAKRRHYFDAAVPEASNDAVKDWQFRALGLAGTNEKEG